MDTFDVEQWITAEKIAPDISRHNINSYKPNLPVAPDNDELRKILHFFDCADDFMALYQNEEFKEGLTCEIKLETISKTEEDMGMTRRESLFHNHDFFEMIYVIKGECINTVENTPLKLHEGDLLMFNLQTVHKIELLSPQSAVLNTLVGKELFSESFLALFSSEDDLFQFYIHSLYNRPDKPFLIFHLQNEPQIQQTIFDMIQEGSLRMNQYAKIMQLDVERLLIQCTRLLSKENKQKSNQDGLSIDDVLHYLYQNYKTVSLEELSAHFGYATRTMIRHLKKFTGQTFSQLIQEYRLINVCNYLKSTTFPLEEIADYTGYSDRGYMDKQFKKMLKISPAEYRRQYQKVI